MIQPIYTSVSDAQIVPCGKRGKPIKSEPIPLLRDKYLGEYRTELERAKVRKNLGIADGSSLIWGNIDGTIEAQKDLVRYIEQKWEYTTDVVENITTVKEALDYALFFIGQYEANTEEIEALAQAIEGIKNNITNLEESLGEDIKEHTEQITAINASIESLNEAIENIDVDKNILNWIQKSLENSKTIELKNDSLDVIISAQENNAIHLVQEVSEDGQATILPGIYVKDLEPTVNEMKESQEDLIQKVNSNIENITEIQGNIETISTYQTDLPDDTVSNVVEGATVEQLKGKPFNEIIDTLLFPTVVRDLIYPQLYYSFSSQILEVGTPLLSPTLTFIQNDAGIETSREETISYNSSPVESLAYDSIGTYTHSGTVTYEAGEYLVDNKGQVTNKRIEAGSLTTTAQVVATYPWYTGNENGTIKQQLIPFGQSSGIVDFSLTGRAVIKLPGNNTQLNSFTVDGGLGYLNVDLNGWQTSTEQINGFPYKVWTKIDSYSSALPHRINFILVQ